MIQRQLARSPCKDDTKIHKDEHSVLVAVDKRGQDGMMDSVTGFIAVSAKVQAQI